MVKDIKIKVVDNEKTRHGNCMKEKSFWTIFNFQENQLVAKMMVTRPKRNKILEKEMVGVILSFEVFFREYLPIRMIMIRKEMPKPAGNQAV